MLQRKGIGSGKHQETTTLSSEQGKISSSWSLGREWRSLVAILAIFRTLNALLSYSAFVPDEYWQALEVAHKMVFGYPLNVAHITVANKSLSPPPFLALSLD